MNEPVEDVDIRSTLQEAHRLLKEVEEKCEHDVNICYCDVKQCIREIEVYLRKNQNEISLKT